MGEETVRVWMMGIAVVSVLGTVNAFILHGISQRLGRLEERQEKLQTVDGCVRAQGSCKKEVEADVGRHCEESRALWERLNRHSHTGLPDGSKVTIGS